MEYALCFVESLIGDGSSRCIKMVVKFLQVDKGDFRSFLDLADDLFSEVVEVLSCVH